MAISSSDKLLSFDLASPIVTDSSSLTVDETRFRFRSKSGPFLNGGVSNQYNITWPDGWTLFSNKHIYYTAPDTSGKRQLCLSGSQSSSPSDQALAFHSEWVSTASSLPSNIVAMLNDRILSVTDCLRLESSVNVQYSITRILDDGSSELLSTHTVSIPALFYDSKPEVIAVQNSDDKFLVLIRHASAVDVYLVRGQSYYKISNHGLTALGKAFRVNSNTLPCLSSTGAPVTVSSSEYVFIIEPSQSKAIAVSPTGQVLETYVDAVFSSIEARTVFLMEANPSSLSRELCVCFSGYFRSASTPASKYCGLTRLASTFQDFKLPSDNVKAVQSLGCLYSEITDGSPVRSDPGQSIYSIQNLTRYNYSANNLDQVLLPSMRSTNPSFISYDEESLSHEIVPVQGQLDAVSDFTWAASASNKYGTYFIPGHAGVDLDYVNLLSKTTGEIVKIVVSKYSSGAILVTTGEACYIIDNSNIQYISNQSCVKVENSVRSVDLVTVIGSNVFIVSASMLHILAGYTCKPIVCKAYTFQNGSIVVSDDPVYIRWLNGQGTKLIIAGLGRGGQGGYSVVTDISLLSGSSLGLFLNSSATFSGPNTFHSDCYFNYSSRFERVYYILSDTIFSASVLDVYGLGSVKKALPFTITNWAYVWVLENFLVVWAESHLYISSRKLWASKLDGSVIDTPPDNDHDYDFHGFDLDSLQEISSDFRLGSINHVFVDGCLYLFESVARGGSTQCCCTIDQGSYTFHSFPPAYPQTANDPISFYAKGVYVKMAVGKDVFTATPSGLKWYGDDSPDIAVASNSTMLLNSGVAVLPAVYRNASRAVTGSGYQVIDGYRAFVFREIGSETNWSWEVSTVNGSVHDFTNPSLMLGTDIKRFFSNLNYKSGSYLFSGSSPAAVSYNNFLLNPYTFGDDFFYSSSLNSLGGYKFHLVVTTSLGGYVLTVSSTIPPTLLRLAYNVYLLNTPAYSNCIIDSDNLSLDTYGRDWNNRIHWADIVSLVRFPVQLDKYSELFQADSIISLNSGYNLNYELHPALRSTGMLLPHITITATKEKRGYPVLDSPNDSLVLKDWDFYSIQTNLYSSDIVPEYGLVVNGSRKIVRSSLSGVKCPTPGVGGIVLPIPLGCSVQNVEMPFSIARWATTFSVMNILSDVYSIAGYFLTNILYSYGSVFSINDRFYFIDYNRIWLLNMNGGVITSMSDICSSAGMSVIATDSVSAFLYSAFESRLYRFVGTRKLTPDLSLSSLERNPSGMFLQVFGSLLLFDGSSYKMTRLENGYTGVLPFGDVTEFGSTKEGFVCYSSDGSVFYELPYLDDSVMYRERYSVSDFFLESQVYGSNESLFDIGRIFLRFEDVDGGKPVKVTLALYSINPGTSKSAPVFTADVSVCDWSLGFSELVINSAVSSCQFFYFTLSCKKSKVKLLSGAVEIVPAKGKTLSSKNSVVGALSTSF